MKRRHTTVSPADSSGSGTDAAASSLPFDEPASVDERGRSLRRTNLGVRIMAFQAAYKSFFDNGLTRRRACLLEVGLISAKFPTEATAC
jgi:hypothetical protein